jgi:hypothetical protein
MLSTKTTTAQDPAALPPIVVDYAIAGAFTHFDLTNMVQDNINKGYQLYGFPFTSFDGTSLKFYQSMVKYKKTSKRLNSNKPKL